MFNRKEYLSIEEVALQIGCTQQNIYQAIWKGWLRAIKYDGKRYVKHEWLNEWRSHWRSKIHSKYEGKPTFDTKNGELAVKHVAEILGIREQSVYHLVRVGHLPCTRKGSYIVIDKDDLECYIKQKEKRRYA